MIQELHRMLALVGWRVRRLRVRWALAACWFAWAAVAWLLGTVAHDLRYTGPQLALSIAVGALVTAAVCQILVSRRTRNPRWVAQRIETRHPELGAVLLAAIEQAPSPSFRRLGYLQSTVVREAIRHGREHNWSRDVPAGMLRFAQLAQLGAFALLVAACTMFFSHGDAVARSADPTSRTRPSREPHDTHVVVEPGDAEIERGTTLLVVANFGRNVPSEATLVFHPMVESVDPPGNEHVTTRSMIRSFEDPTFVGRVAWVNEDLVYAVAFSRKRTEQYRVTVFDYPALERADAELNYPEYTSLEPKIIEDVRHLAAVEGTELTFRCRLNKRVEKSLLVDRSGEEFPLVLTEDNAPVYSVTCSLDKSRRFKLHLTDHEGRRNKLPPEFVVNVTPNRPPKLKIARPARDVRVSPIEELDVVGDTSDDFGLLRYGVSYSIGGSEPRDVVLLDRASSETSDAVKEAALSHVIEFETLEAEPNQLLSYYVWAEDHGPDGQPRQTMSDMFFAEVRHFEEIFRQGDQPTQQQLQEAREQQGQQQGQGASQRATELAELQKQIINATWALIRREQGKEPSDAFADDVSVLVDSQQQALGQLEEVVGDVSDSESRTHAADAQEQMENALARLDEVKTSAGIDGLRPALSAEQAAYQALLKLRAREFSVVEGNSQQQQQGAPSSSASGPNSRSQQQLNQLELSAEENRYETQSRAQDQLAQAQNGTEEARQVLDRLRELSRRQEDLNERVRQLQSELQAAETSEKREQIERELMRLREQQQEILRDTDQLQSDLENSQNADQTQDAQGQLENARNRAQQASEALQEGRLADAVAEGTRAGRELVELRDEFRRRAADRFGEEMRELRDSARQLDENQQQLADRLFQQREQRNRSLRDGGAREKIAEGLADQRREYEELIERMQETVQQAEEPEPLLARGLYDTVRQATDDQVAEALDLTNRLLDVAIDSEAHETMRAANRGIRRLREGVDRAAESVLGDETEALRRAARELEDLEEELNREIREARGEDDRARQRAGQPTGEQERGPTGQDTSQQPQEGGPSADRQQDAQQQDQPIGRQPGNAEQPSNAGGERQGDNQEEPNQSARQGGRPRDLADWLDDWQGGPDGPITGDDFRQWNDRMRDVEDLLDDPDLRAEVARIRDRAEAARADYKRRSKKPDWDQLIDTVVEPLAELRERIRDEIRRKESPDSLVPIDRDPVPTDYIDTVREYYQRLGSGE